MESLLYAVSEKDAFAFSVAELLRLGKNEIDNSHSPPVLPASICAQSNFGMQHMRAFHHSNKPFLLGRGESWELHCHNSKLRISEPDFMPPPPRPHSDPYFVANIRGNIYLFARVPSVGFWVLKSGTWGSLPAPPLSPVDPTLRRAGVLKSPWCQWFASDDKLFLLAYQPGKEEIVVYDPQSDVWEKVEDKDTYFQLSSFGFDSMSTVSVPDVGNNCSVALTFRGENIRAGEYFNIKLYALLLDKQTNLVRCCQSLDECSNEIQVQQSKVWWYSPSMKCVDLGNGMVCALIIGSTQLRRHAGLEPLLWILVFTLAWTQEDQRFLSVVDVSVNQVYTRHLANPKDPDCLHSAFIVTPKDFSTAFVEQKHSLNWPGDKTKKDSQAQLPRTYTMKNILGELQTMRIYMEGRLQSIEASLARQQDAIDHLCTHFGIPNRCGIIPHPRTSQGKNNGKGYYIYEKGSKPKLDLSILPIVEELRRLANIMPGGKPISITDQEILEMILFPIVNEAGCVLDEGMVIRASDLDIACVLGMSFPSYSFLIGAKHVYNSLKKWSELYGNFYKPSRYQ